MEKLFLFLLFCPVSSAVIHSLVISVTASSGIPNFPEFMGAAEVDGNLVGNCDSNRKTVEPKHDLVKKFLSDNPEHMEWYRLQCLTIQPNNFKVNINNLKLLFNQRGGVHVLQVMTGCEQDDETGELNGFVQCGYDGEDLMSFDLKTSTWTALKPQAEQIKQIWDADEATLKFNKNLLTQTCPEFLKKYVDFGKIFLQRTERPSVSLLQKTPSSPVSCHASGFYPERSSLFWRKDGEEIHEDVDHGEILPNHDGTFQMSVDLDLSSVTPEDWRRYDCVFQLSGLKDDIVTRLDKDVIRTNWEKPSNMILPVTAAVVVVALVLITVTGFIVYKRHKAKHSPPTPDSGCELADRQTESRPD